MRSLWGTCYRSIRQALLRRFLSQRTQLFEEQNHLQLRAEGASDTEAEQADPGAPESRRENEETPRPPSRERIQFQLPHEYLKHAQGDTLRVLL